MYYTYGSYASTSAPGIPGYTARYYGSGWADTAGYSRIIALSTTQITVRVYRGNSADFSNVYAMDFRFYMERLTFSGCQSVSFWHSYYGTFSRSFAGCGGVGRHMWTLYSYYTNGGFDWPYWHGGYYIDFTFNFNSITGDVSNNANQLFVSTTITWYKSYWHTNDQGRCGCCSWSTCSTWHDCCWYSYYDCSPCVTGCNCRWYYDWGTFILTGGNTQAWTPSRTLASSYGVDLVSRQRNV